MLTLRQSVPPVLLSLSPKMSYIHLHLSAFWALSLNLYRPYYASYKTYHITGCPFRICYHICCFKCLYNKYIFITTGDSVMKNPRSCIPHRLRGFFCLFRPFIDSIRAAVLRSDSASQPSSPDRFRRIYPPPRKKLPQTAQLWP